MKPVSTLVAASVLGLTIGAAVPASEALSPFAVPALFVQTLVTVGTLAEADAPGRRTRTAARMLVVHHLVASIPLMGLGLLLGLDSALGIGAFVLGAVPPAAGLPAYAAACGLHVRLMVRFSLMAYGTGVVVTPVLLIAALGLNHAPSAVAMTLVVGLVLPAGLGAAGRRLLQKVPRWSAFGLVSVSMTVAALGLGQVLLVAVEEVRSDTATITWALLIGIGRCLWGAAIAALLAERHVRIETLLSGGYKNSVLAAILGLSAAGPVAALPGLVGVLTEASLLVAVSRFAAGIRPAPVPPPSSAPRPGPR